MVMPGDAQKPWPPGAATERIRRIARGPLDLSVTIHLGARLEERDLIMGDVLHVLKTGNVYDEGEPATRSALWKYRMEGKSPNSGSRTLRVIVILGAAETELKIVTVMWADEPKQGS